MLVSLGCWGGSLLPEARRDARLSSWPGGILEPKRSKKGAVRRLLVICRLPLHQGYERVRHLARPFPVALPETRSNRTKCILGGVECEPQKEWAQDVPRASRHLSSRARPSSPASGGMPRRHRSGLRAAPRREAGTEPVRGRYSSSVVSRSTRVKRVSTDGGSAGGVPSSGAVNASAYNNRNGTTPLSLFVIGRLVLHLRDPSLQRCVARDDVVAAVRRVDGIASTGPAERWTCMEVLERQTLCGPLEQGSCDAKTLARET